MPITTAVVTAPITSSPAAFGRVIPIRVENDMGAWLQGLMQSMKGYKLPGDPALDNYIIPVSGGADSAALAIIMHRLFPDQKFQLAFTDTVAEDPEIYDVLSSLENYLQMQVTRLIPEKGLYELIEEYGGFLPSHQKRWCTRVLKLENFKPWISKFAGVDTHMLIGIRADEPFRLAFAIEEATTHFPFLDMGVVRADVFRVLQQTIGIPKFYTRRTRSGCSSCFYQRRSELVGLLQQLPWEFAKAARCEKLSPADQERHPEAMPLWMDSGISENWQGLPVPVDAKQSKVRNRMRKQTTIFGDVGIYVGGEFFVDGLFGFDEFIWHRRIVSYSPTLAGIKKQLNDRYQHLLATSEVYEMSPDEVRRNAKFAIWYVELPDLVFDPSGPGNDGYTWQQGSSYRQLRHIIQWVTRALHAEYMGQEAALAPHVMSVQHEWSESARKGLESLQHDVGRVVQSTWHKPTEKVPELSLEEEIKQSPCPMCSI